MRPPRQRLVESALAAAAAAGLAMAALAAAASAGTGLAAAAGRAASQQPVKEKQPPSEVNRGCPPERAQNGEVRLVFLGDSGYGQGFSEWGAQGQDAVAARLARLALEPDLVFFVGDNIYWRGSADLYKSRFDDVYEPLIRGCKVHVALGNHDVKGCRAITENEQWESCLAELRSSLVADRRARYMRQGVGEAEATEKAKQDVDAETGSELEKEALRTWRGNCLPGDATAYEEARKGPQACNAKAALTHTNFGFGSIEKGDPPGSQRQRYYSILWPLPKLDEAGDAVSQAPAGASDKPATTRPIVDVIVLDSNTLDVEGSLLQAPAGGKREDKLQLIWLRNAMSQWLPAPGESHRIWKILAIHHAPFTPKACACRLFGRCIGGHGDEPSLQQQLKRTLEDLEPPDLVFAGHNHIYARSHPLDRDGRPVTSGTGGVRYFVTGGGGAPLYSVAQDDSRFARALTVYHFVYLRLTASAAFWWTMDEGGRVRDSGCFEKGSNVDMPLAESFRYDDSLPPRCAP